MKNQNNNQTSSVAGVCFKPSRAQSQPTRVLRATLFSAFNFLSFFRPIMYGKLSLFYTFYLKTFKYEIEKLKKCYVKCFRVIGFALILVFSSFLASKSSLKAEIVTASFYTKASAQREGTSGIFTASGERFNEKAQTCAHPSKPFGTILKVTNPENGVWVECKISDRGPSDYLVKKGRKLDTTPRVWELLGLDQTQGLARVKIEEIRHV